MSTAIADDHLRAAETAAWQFEHRDEHACWPFPGCGLVGSEN